MQFGAFPERPNKTIKQASTLASQRKIPALYGSLMPASRQTPDSLWSWLQRLDIPKEPPGQYPHALPLPSCRLPFLPQSSSPSSQSTHTHQALRVLGTKGELFLGCEEVKRAPRQMEVMSRPQFHSEGSCGRVQVRAWGGQVSWGRGREGLRCHWRGALTCPAQVLPTPASDQRCGCCGPERRWGIGGQGSPILRFGLAPEHQLSAPLGAPRLLGSACPALSPPPPLPVPISRAAPPPPFPPKTQDQSPTIPHVLLHQGHQSGLPEMQLGPWEPLLETSLKFLRPSLTPETTQNSLRSCAPSFLHLPQTLLSLNLPCAAPSTWNVIPALRARPNLPSSGTSCVVTSPA